MSKKTFDFYSRPCGRGDKLAASASRLRIISTHAPAGGATVGRGAVRIQLYNFYSRPCGRGDTAVSADEPSTAQFLLTPLREGRRMVYDNRNGHFNFYSRPCGRGDARALFWHGKYKYFYSRPCGRGDVKMILESESKIIISTHAPAGGATNLIIIMSSAFDYFYSRPCGRGDSNFPQVRHEVLRQIAER